MNQLFPKFEADESRLSDEINPYRIISPLLRYDWLTNVLYIKKYRVRENEPGWKNLNLNFYWLPVSVINSSPISVASRQDLCVIIVAAIDRYLLNSRQNKSLHIVVTNQVITYCKIFEYLWINGCFRPSDLPSEEWGKLAEKLAIGGWSNALGIPARVVKLIANDESAFRSMLGSRFHPDKRFRISESYKKILGTNVHGIGNAVIKNLLLQASRSEVLRKSGDLNLYAPLINKGIGSTNLNVSLGVCNSFVDLKVPGALNFLPINGSYKFGKRYGKLAQKTENLTPESAAAILKFSFEFLLSSGEAIVELMEDVSEKLLQESLRFTNNPDFSSAARQRIVKNKKEILLNSPKRIAVEMNAGVSITNIRNSVIVRAKEVSFHELINCLMLSCFVIIALMNARRKDEIIHPVVGMHFDGIKTVDEDLQLHMCEFYIEKTDMDYQWFWVTSITKKAVDILKRVSIMAWRWGKEMGAHESSMERSKKLFVSPFFGDNTGNGINFFKFYNKKNPCRLFYSSISSNLGYDIELKPHMLRRGYGLIHHYLYENTTLSALARKYRHHDLITPLHYVTNGFDTQLSNNAISLWSAPRRSFLNAQSEDAKDIIKIIDMVGYEKMEAFVLSVISGEKRFVGGFAKLVQRFNRFFSLDYSFNGMSKSQKARSLSDSLQSRGHKPYPYPHATCMAGETRHGASCATNGDLARENAKTSVCGKCRYSCINIEHIHFMEEEADRLTREAEVNIGTIKGLNAQTERDNVLKIINLQKARLEFVYEEK